MSLNAQALTRTQIIGIELIQALANSKITDMLSPRLLEALLVTTLDKFNLDDYAVILREILKVNAQLPALPCRTDEERLLHHGHAIERLRLKIRDQQEAARQRKMDRAKNNGGEHE